MEPANAVTESANRSSASWARCWAYARRAGSSGPGRRPALTPAPRQPGGSPTEVGQAGSARVPSVVPSRPPLLRSGGSALVQGGQRSKTSTSPLLTVTVTVRGEPGSVGTSTRSSPELLRARTWYGSPSAG